MKSSINSRRAFFKNLKKAVSQSITDDVFDANNFFDQWFCRSGKAYYFLFRKNLSVTNIQFAELLALVRHHLTWNGKPFHEVQITNLASVMESLLAVKNGFNEAIAQGAS